MKWLTPILAMLLLVGCSRNEVIQDQEVFPGFYLDPNSAIFYPLDPRPDQWDVTVRKSKIPFDPGFYSPDPEFYYPIPLIPWVPPQPESHPTKDEQVQEVPVAEKNCNPNDQSWSVKDSQVQKDVPDAPRRKIKYHVDTSRKDPDGNFIIVRIYEDEEK